MQFMFNPQYFFSAYNKGKKYKPNKDYDTDKLISLCPSKSRSVLKNILMLDNAICKLNDILKIEHAQSFNIEHIYSNSTVDLTAKNVWEDFIVNYQRALQPEIEKQENILKGLKQNLTYKKNSEKFEMISFYVNNLKQLLSVNTTSLKEQSYSEFCEEARPMVDKIVLLANYYRHIKEYERIRDSFQTYNDSRGITYNKQNIFELLGEIENKIYTKPQFDDVYKLYDLINNNQQELRFEGSKKKIISIENYIKQLDKGYLQRIGLETHFEYFYSTLIKKANKASYEKYDTEYEKFCYLRKRFVEMTKTKDAFCANNIEFFADLDNMFVRNKLNNKNLVVEAIPADTEGICKKQLIGVLDTYNRIISTENYNVAAALRSTVSFEPFTDANCYTSVDFYQNLPAIVDPVEYTFKTENLNNNTTINPLKTNNSENSKQGQHSNNLEENTTIKEMEQAQQSDLPYVDPNLPLDQKIEEYFKNLVGLNQVKETLLEIMAKKQLEGKNYKQGQMHMAFLGNPGTGKTTVARIVGKILHENGLINSDKVVECKFSDLYQNYVGFSAKATQEKIKEAEGGVLFIDEAHQLASTNSNGNDFRKEIINVLVPELENNKNLLVIFAGYSKEMLEMLTGSDKGMFSRVNHRVDFKDFSKQDIMNLFKMEISKKKNRDDENYIVSDEAIDVVDKYLDVLILARHDNFANGREVRTTVNKILNKFAVITLKRDDIKTIDRDTMVQIIGSNTFVNEIMSGNEQDSQVINAWQEFSAKVLCKPIINNIELAEANVQ